MPYEAIICPERSEGQVLFAQYEKKNHHVSFSVRHVIVLNFNQSCLTSRRHDHHCPMILLVYFDLNRSPIYTLAIKSFSPLSYLFSFMKICFLSIKILTVV